MTNEKEKLIKMTSDLVDRGLIIEAGWEGLVLACEIQDAPEDQLREMRMAFFAGAQHLFTSIMVVLDPGVEPTDKDMQRINVIDEELRRFGNQFIMDNIPTEGRA